jgi:alpha-amylase
MVDVVANHMGKGDISVNKPAPLNEQSAYHAACSSEIDYTNQTSVEMCEIAGLPDINTQSPEVRTMFQTWIKWLVTEYSFDGVRIDTVKHVEKEFWKSFSDAAGVYCIGEVWDGSPDYLAEYADTMPGLLDYAVFYPVNKFYQQTGGSAQNIVDMHDTITALFPDPTALGTFIDNHDNPRWLSEQGDISLFKNALAYVVLARGIPIVYYGSEQGYNGGADPANRESLWNSNFNTESDLYVTLSKMGAARKSAGGLAGDDHVHLHVADNAYAWSRAGGDLIVLTTNTGKGTTGNYCFNAQKNNGAWTNVLGSGNVTSDDSGNLCLDVSDGEPVVLVAADSTDAPAPEISATVSAAPSASASASISAAPITTETTIPDVITSAVSNATAAVILSVAKTTLATVVATPASPSACPSTVAVTFTGNVKTKMGETIKLVGNTAELGNWDLEKALVLSANGYTALKPVWSVTVQVPAGSKLKYKFVKVGTTGRVTWEGRKDRAYEVPCKASAKVGCTWGL